MGVLSRDVLAYGEWDETSILGHTTLSRLLLYTANAICVRDDETLVLVTLREKNRLPADYPPLVVYLIRGVLPF